MKENYTTLQVIAHSDQVLNGNMIGTAKWVFLAYQHFDLFFFSGLFYVCCQFLSLCRTLSELYLPLLLILHLISLFCSNSFMCFVNVSLVLLYLHLSHTHYLSLSSPLVYLSPSLLLFSISSPSLISISSTLDCTPTCHHAFSRICGLMCLCVWMQPGIPMSQSPVWCDVVAAAGVCLFTSHSHLEFISNAFASGGSLTHKHARTYRLVLCLCLFCFYKHITTLTR